MSEEAPVPQERPRLLASLYVQLTVRGGEVTAHLLGHVPPPALELMAQQLEAHARNLRKQASPIVLPASALS